MDKSDREKIIIDAALKVFSTKGYASTRMADIAKEADMSYGLVYHYFENKEKLFDAIVEDWWTGFYDELEMLKQSTMTTEEKLVEIIRYILKVYENKPNQLSIFVTEVSRGFVYHTDSKGKDKFNKLFSLCKDIMLEGQQRGLLRDDIQANYLTYLFLGSIDTFLSILILGNEKISASRQKRFIDGITNVFLHGASINGRRDGS
jgi:TetR/AcrR family transcriptional regulator, fatty acid metabolism regulator protein